MGADLSVVSYRDGLGAVGLGGCGLLRSRAIRLSMTPYLSTIRVYYEDTDMAGVVYYANYLKYLERGRSDAVRAAGMEQLAMRDVHDLVFVVRRVEADYLRPARFDDVLTVETGLGEMSGARFVMPQRVLRG